MPDNRWVVCEDLSGPVFDTTLLQADSNGESETEGDVLSAAVQGEAHKGESADVCGGDDTVDSYDQSGYAYYKGQDDEQPSDVDVNHDTDDVSMHVAEPSQVDACVSQAVQTDHDDAVSCAAEESREADKPVQSCYDRDDSDHSSVDQDSDDHEDSELMSCVDEDTDDCVDGDHSCVDQDSDNHEDSDRMSCTDEQCDECLDSDLHEDDATVPLCVDNDTDPRGDAKQCVSDADSVTSSTSTLSFFLTVSSVKCLVFDTPTDWDSEPTMSDSSDHDEPVQVVGGVLCDLIAAVQNVERGQECVSARVTPDIDVHNAENDSECVTPAVAVSQGDKHVKCIVKRKRSKPQVVPTMSSSHRLKKQYDWKQKGPTFVQCTYCLFTSSVIENVRAH